MIAWLQRRWLAVVLLVLFSAAALEAHRRFAGGIPRWPHLTGWALLAVMLVLTAYNARKKLPFLPLGSSQGWLTFHVYAGWFSAVLFGIHVGFRLPNGWFDGTLAGLYALVMLSGVGGLILSRLVPRRLTTRGGEVLYERIPAIRRALRDQAEALALASIPQGGVTTLADYYTRRLRDFFAGPRHLWLHLCEVPRPLNTLVAELDDLRRFLNTEERNTLARLADLVRQKDGLDYHQAHQAVLKGWLFVHIPLTYSLLVFTFVHVVLVFAFSGGVS